MKVFIFYLAILLIVITFIPYLFSINNYKTDNFYNAYKIELYNHNSDKIKSMLLEEYIVGVVCAEMPAQFNVETLKAQAVAARTYAIKKISSSQNSHKKGDLCTDYTHCQAYVSFDDAKIKWKKNANKYYNKIKDAVNSTAGEYLEYNGEPVIAVFHSCSNGVTEKSSDVWSSSVPYLTNVSSEGDYLKKDYISTNVFSYSEFILILENKLKIKVDTNKIAIGNINYSTGGNVLDIEIFGNVISGTDIRKLYSLKSTAFELAYDGSEFTFTVSGSGHGVGMSQYGAENMAKNSASYKEILSHYYPGTQLVKMNKIN